MLEVAAEYYLKNRADEMARRAERLARVALVRKSKKTAPANQNDDR